MPATPVSPPAYRRREPEKEPLYQILAGHPETFLQQARTAEHRLPLQVEKEMRAYLECGILAYGFVRARCEDCGASRAVAEPAAADGDTSAPSCAHRLGWAALLARVLGADLSACAACGGRLRIIAALTDPTSIRTYLEGVGLPGVPPPRAPPPPQFEFAA